jgi:hypothetical protein
MKPLLGCVALWSALAAPPSGEGWWNSAWKFRRPIAVKNNLDAELQAGFPIQMDLDLDFLGLRDKVKKDLSDLAVVHRGKRLPLVLLPGRPGEKLRLGFRTAAALRAGASDAGYALYYGNPDAAPEPGLPSQLFEIYEDFSRAESLAERFELDKDVTAEVREGALLIREVAAGRTEHAPARLVLKGAPPEGGFALSFDLEIDSSNAAALGFAVHVELKEAAAADPAAGRRIDDLIDKLGDLDWEVREQATRDLIKLGKPALPKLLAATRSNDAEVKWRAEHVLRQIREHSPAAAITAAVLSGNPSVGPIALSTRIGGRSAKVPFGGGWPVRLRVTVLRDQDGEVTVLWNNGKPQTGSLKGPVERISFTLYKGSAAPLGTIRVDSLVVKRHVDDDSRPTHTLELEETRP